MTHDIKRNQVGRKRWLFILKSYRPFAACCCPYRCVRMFCKHWVPEVKLMISLELKIFFHMRFGAWYRCDELKEISRLQASTILDKTTWEKWPLGVQNSFTKTAGSTVLLQQLPLSLPLFNVDLKKPQFLGKRLRPTNNIELGKRGWGVGLGS